MAVEIGYFYSAFAVIKYVFGLLVGSLGEHFNFIFYVSIISASISVIFGLGVSIFHSAKNSNSKKGGS